MSDTFSIKIDIPSDNDGFVLLQCPLCGAFFKVKADDYEDEGVLELYCPECGLCADSYFTEDVIKLAMAMAKNLAVDLINNEMKKFERSFKGKGISFKADKSAKREYEQPIYATIDALDIKYFECCKKEAKIKPLLKICGYYCPFCGVKYFEN